MVKLSKEEGGRDSNSFKIQLKSKDDSVLAKKVVVAAGAYSNFLPGLKVRLPRL